MDHLHEDEAALLALSKTATRAPWSAYQPCEYPSDFRIAAMGPDPTPSGSAYVGRLTRSHSNEPYPREADADFIAAARNLTPTLLERLSAARREAEELRERVEQLEGGLQGLIDYAYESDGNLDAFIEHHGAPSHPVNAAHALLAPPAERAGEESR